MGTKNQKTASLDYAFGLSFVHNSTSVFILAYEMSKKLFLLFLIFLTAFASANQVEREQLRYNQVQQKASHNSYQRKWDILTQLKDFKIRTLEFDIHRKRNSKDDDFWVYHNIKGDATVCSQISECFSQVMSFHQMTQNHEVITIFFDAEPKGINGISSADLNKLFSKSFPLKSIFKPSELLSACPSAKNLQESVTHPGCAWPTLSELKGKFIFVITGGFNVFNQLNYNPRTDLFFIATTARNPLEINLFPNQIFFNMPGPDPFAKVVNDKGFVSRCYWLNTKEQYEKAMEIGANLLATDLLDPKEFPWTNTATENGFPFRLIKERSKK